MSLARAWRRQLYGASSAALIVPCAMLSALVVLALGGSFSGVGVLGQIFAGPPAPGVGGGVFAAGHVGGAAHALPVAPVAAVRPLASRRGKAVPVGRGQGGGAPVSSGGTDRSAGPPVRSAPASPTPAPPALPAPAQSAPQPSPSPQPQPKPQPTPVDKIVQAVTPVTQPLPGPVGPAATQVVQTAGSAADGLLPPSSGAPGAQPGVKLP